MGRIKGKRDAVILKRRKDLIMIATYLTVAEKGYATITIKDIAEKANISHALLFYYFKSKEEIFIETLKWVNSRIFKRLKSKIESVDHPIERLKIRIEDSFLSIKENRIFYLYYLDFMREGARNKVFKKPNVEFINFAKEKSIAILKQGIDMGFFRKNLNLEETSSMIKANIDGLLFQWLFDKEETFLKYKTWCLDIIFHFVLKDEALIKEFSILT